MSVLRLVVAVQLVAIPSAAAAESCRPLAEGSAQRTIVYGVGEQQHYLVTTGKADGATDTGFIVTLCLVRQLGSGRVEYRVRAGSGAQPALFAPLAEGDCISGPWGWFQTRSDGIGTGGNLDLRWCIDPIPLRG